MTFQHIFLSINNLVCVEQITRKSNLCMKAYHKTDMIDRSTQLSAWLLCSHYVLSVELEENPSVSQQSLNNVLRRMRKKENNSSLQFPSLSISSLA